MHPLILTAATVSSSISPASATTKSTTALTRWLSLVHPNGPALQQWSQTAVSISYLHNSPD